MQIRDKEKRILVISVILFMKRFRFVFSFYSKIRNSSSSSVAHDHHTFISEIRYSLILDAGVYIFVFNCNIFLIYNITLYF